MLENLIKYIESRIDLIKFETKESITEAVISIVRIVTLLILTLFTTIFLSIALALYLNQVLESTFVGFLIVGGFYLILSLIALLFKDNQVFKEKIMNGIFKEKDKEGTTTKEN